MNCMNLDLETFSDVDLKKSGVYKYAESPNFEILLFGYAVDGGEVQVIDIARGEEVPQAIIKALIDDSVIKYSFNCSFERICISVWLCRNYPQYFNGYGINGDTGGKYLDSTAWHCSMVWSAYLGLPLSLAGVGAVLGLDKQKMEEGKNLIRYFCIPCAPTKTNGGRTRNLPIHDEDKWDMFKSYNERDVETEMAIQAKLSRFPVPDFIWDEYHLDQEINDRGIGIDLEFVNQAIEINKEVKDDLMDKMQKLTGLENPNSVLQMREWLSEHGLDTDSLGKKDVAELIKTAPEGLIDVLKLRQQIARSSVKKYQAMSNVVCHDKKAHGMFQFYGANRTGRFSGRLIQLQNLPQNHIADLAEARALVKSGDIEALRLLYEDIPDTLSQLIRTAFVPREGRKFIVSDFSAIEARVIAWLACEKWRLDLFENGGDIYCMSASQMFKVPVVKHGINGELRQKGKIAELACIAEGQMVLTDKGLVPIEKVSLKHRLWDGESWVSHGGVIYKGERKVITYEGLTATPDHLVWVEGQPGTMEFGKAASCGAHIVQTGNGRETLWLGENNICGKKMEQKTESLLCSNTMHRLRKYSMAGTQQFANRKVKRLSAMFTATKDTILVRTEAHCSKTEVRKSKRQSVSQLRRKGNKIYVSKCNGCRVISDEEIWCSKTQSGIGQNRQQWGLCTGKYPIRKQDGKLCKQEDYYIIQVFAGLLAICGNCCEKKAVERHDQRRNYRRCETGCHQQKKEMEAHKCKARVYDIRNAGQHHRFTVSGKLVHNCGYGGSTGALKAMGALDMGLKEEELQPLVNSWRLANPHIVQFWWNVDKAVKDCVKERKLVETHGIRFSYESGFLFITLPSGRRLAYVKPRMGENRFGGESVTYEGIGATKKWDRLESYGPKFCENITQAVARDILVYAMKTLCNCSIVGHVHDELIIEADRGMSLAAVCEQMGRTPPWAEGLKLRADGYEFDFYKKE